MHEVIRLPSFIHLFIHSIHSFCIGGYSKVARVLSLNGSTMREVRILYCTIVRWVRCQSIVYICLAGLPYLASSLTHAYLPTYYLPIYLHAYLPHHHIIQLFVSCDTTSGVHPRQPQQRYHRHRVGSFHGSLLPHDSNC